MLKAINVLAIVIFSTLTGCTETTWIKDGLSPSASASQLSRDEALCLQEAYKNIRQPSGGSAVYIPPPQINPYGGGWAAGVSDGIATSMAITGNPTVQYRGDIAAYKESCLVLKGWKESTK